LPKLPVLRARILIGLLSKIGFAEVRQRGSHKQFRHADGRVTTVPVHSGRDISPNLLRKILTDIHVSPDEFLRLVER
jgi:predicted RNA binding protein YcfA (HicA-like mRNA interferase family)